MVMMLSIPGVFLGQFGDSVTEIFLMAACYSSHDGYYYLNTNSEGCKLISHLIYSQLVLTHIQLMAQTPYLANLS